jgi:hypothetical protein
LQLIASYVQYIAFLKINQGIRHFKLSNTIFEKSQNKNNANSLFNNKDLIKYLNHNKIDLIYILYHGEIDLGNNYSKNIYKYANMKGQKDLEIDMEQYNLLITYYSSISFDFMFQNKPVLFYTIDKSYNNTNDIIYIANYFLDINLLINKIKFYVHNSFIIDNELHNNYDSIFFIKLNIINKTK